MYIDGDEHSIWVIAKGRTRAREELFIEPTGSALFCRSMAVGVASLLFPAGLFINYCFVRFGVMNKVLFPPVKIILLI